MMSEFAYLDTIRHEVDELLQRCIDGSNLVLYEMVRYHLGFIDEAGNPDSGSGKRLRPLFCCLACEACSGDWRPALAAAAAVELTHNFSLVHDDIEDGDHERHHRPTVWSRWGIEQGINAGDALWALAWETLARATSASVSPQVVVECLRRLALRSRQMIEGQYLDLADEGSTNMRLDEYLRMVEGKTGALLACSFELGALCGGAGSEVADAYAGAGRMLGLAFQIEDDILGVWGDPAITGKPVGNDIRQKKMSLPAVCAMANLQGESLRALRTIYTAKAMPADREVQYALELFSQADAREAAERLASEYTSRATEALERLSMQPRAARALRAMINSLVGRPV